MSEYTDSIKRIARQDEPKGSLVDAIDRESIPGNSVPMSSYQEESGGVGLVSPITFEVLTYDDDQDVTMQANNGEFTIKTAETAMITDAEGTEIIIDSIIYPDVP